MKYFSHRDDQFWHVLGEGDESLCGCKITEPALLAGTLVISEGVLTYLDVCEGCLRATRKDD